MRFDSNQTLYNYPVEITCPTIFFDTPAKLVIHMVPDEVLLSSNYEQKIDTLQQKIQVLEQNFDVLLKKIEELNTSDYCSSSKPYRGDPVT